jgi:hypothetical protein
LFGMVVPSPLYTQKPSGQPWGTPTMYNWPRLEVGEGPGGVWTSLEEI